MLSASEHKSIMIVFHCDWEWFAPLLLKVLPSCCFHSAHDAASVVEQHPEERVVRSGHCGDDFTSQGGIRFGQWNTHETQFNQWINQSIFDSMELVSLESSFLSAGSAGAVWWPSVDSTLVLSCCCWAKAIWWGDQVWWKGVSLIGAGSSTFHGSYQMGKASLGFEMMKIVDLSSLLEELNRKNTAWQELNRKRYALMDELAILKSQMEAIDPMTPVTS